MPRITRALISVSDKTKLLDLALALHAMGIEIISTGGSAKLLATYGVPVADVSTYTGCPEMLDGRVKTLHPKIHGAILARRDKPAHLAMLQSANIPPIDMVVVNFYPFTDTVSQPHCSFEEAIENIDIGGPAMVRSAAKNWRDVVVLTDPNQYQSVIQEIQEHHAMVSEDTCFALAVQAFNRISQYDGAISNYLSSLTNIAGEQEQFPDQLNCQFVKLQNLRYGENPHQTAAFYRELQPVPGSLATARQLQGKDLSYNNLADADTAWEAVKQFATPACVIVKHANPCGVALGSHAEEAYRKAFSADPTSAFGGIVALNVNLDQNTAMAIAEQFLEVIIAPGYTDSALRVLAEKSKLRLLQIDLSTAQNREDMKRVGGGLLLQMTDTHPPLNFQVVTQKQPKPQEMSDLLFAWRVAKEVKSNAIVFCKEGRTLGIGAGQMSRVDSVKIAVLKAQRAGLSLHHAVVASDAFFPFRDGVDVLAEAGASSVIQPGGSLRDQEVIAAADAHGLTMLFTGIRHFRH